MALYLVSYDLDNPGQNYEGVIGALKTQGAKRVLLSAWAIRTDSTAEQVRDWIRQYTDQNDRILVSPLDGSWASWNALTDINQV